MKKNALTFILVLALALSFPQIVSANMAAPKDSDIGSSITFEKNDTVAVLAEVLDITVYGSQANIVATYKMKNTGDESVSTRSMFLSPNIKNSGAKVAVNDRDVSFTVESYTLNYNTEIETEDWKYAVLTDGKTASVNDERSVDAITFDMDFAPQEEYDAVVSFVYQLGGYPDLDFDAKMGRIEYYLAPAAMWKNFSGLTINLNLDDDMPIIQSSNLEFKKVGARTYQYVSDTLPKENLEIVIDENWYQNIFSTLRSPYLPMTLIMFSPIILIGAAISVFIIWRVWKKKRQRKQG